MNTRTPADRTRSVLLASFAAAGCTLLAACGSSSTSTQSSMPSATSGTSSPGASSTGSASSTSLSSSSGTSSSGSSTAASKAAAASSKAAASKAATGKGAAGTSSASGKATTGGASGAAGGSGSGASGKSASGKSPSGQEGKPAAGGAAPAGSTGSGACTPTQVVIPSLSINEPVVAMGLNSRGEINPPAHTTMWYTGSPRPGASGISVIAGHVTYDGPDNFYNLDRAAIGSTITLKCSDGTTRALAVTNKASELKADVQRDARVWGHSASPVIAFITCDRSSPMIKGHHTNNYVVWARPA